MSVWLEPKLGHTMKGHRMVCSDICNKHIQSIYIVFFNLLMYLEIHFIKYLFRSAKTVLIVGAPA